MWWKKWWVWLIVVVAVGGGIVAVVARQNAKHPTISTSPQPASVAATDSVAVAAGKQLTANHCSGTGTVALNYAPMKPADISIIDPYGLTVGGHVTPVDHEYYWAKNNVKDSSDVLALADGTLADIEYRPHSANDAARNGVAGDYRVTISYTCTFMSYFDLATSLAPDIEAQLPKGWEQNGHGSNGNTDINIPVKAGQAIAKMGGQSLDFAVWDMTKNNPKLLVPAAYAGEAWKIHTVAPLDYFSAAVKTSILPFYARQAEPRDGYYAYDVAGKLIGSWFLKGSGGYNDPTKPPSGSYWAGHLAITPDWIDPTVWGFSVGAYNGGDAKQFIIKPLVTDPATIGVDTGMVKYELLQGGQYQYANGQQWNQMSTPTGPVTMPTNGVSQATALLQLTDANTLKVEVFPGQTPTQVAAFTAAAKIYTRSGN
ncbi:MAG TPA: hypothetical protein VLE93_01060 [Candidatus Saccharimonadales bacterium]|nr:hypothetical protein [Candidatus Saccharimonadales bacterium]